MADKEDSALVEPLYSIGQVAQLWQVSEGVVRKVFRDRAGVVDLTIEPGERRNGRGGRHSIRIPGSLVLAVMVERGYSRGQADRLLREWSA